MVPNTTWRVLIVDDSQGDDVSELLSVEGVFPDALAECRICDQFDQAFSVLDSQRVDLVVLDLRDDSIELEDESILPGLQVYEQIRERRFVPVIFFTAYPQKVDDISNPFVRVVSRDSPRDLRVAVQALFSTKLPQLLRHLNEELRIYMWEFVDHHWTDMNRSNEQTDISMLLARRLASTLSRESIRRFLTDHGQAAPTPNDLSVVHPMEMYVIPPNNPELLAGDLLFLTVSEKEEYWIVLTPSCDFEQGKAHQTLLAKCGLLSEQTEFKDYSDSIHKKEDPSNNVLKKLKSLIGDNRSGQRERYRFLAGTFRFPDLVVDFQALKQVPTEKLSLDNRVASLDSPFAESMLAGFSRYYGRLGTPNLDVDLVMSRLAEKMQKTKNES
ncbi:hypothetical protein Mal52_61270 [Symmachiella dynata]|uniref:Response regulatory domain-containing protein n=1 Tax=Symmachiella dynata TaxID=2527995 RepID=A0A517ZYM4_9PLAN|nr:hypothetical protein [Symmachiella dynata]QDU47592.1 hypothetical protein Mal52_61270 [Symmachiella dynata]